MRERLIDTTEAGARLGISAMRVRQLCAEKILPAKKVGRDWVIRLSDLDLDRVVNRRRRGRPKKRR